MPNPKTFKLFLKGEVRELMEIHYLDDGQKVEMDKITKIVVPSKKNTKRIAVNKKTMKAILLPSEQHEKWYKEHKEIFLEWRDKMISQHVSLPIDRFKLKILFYFPTSHERDLGNKGETIYDILEDTGIIKNDSFKILRDINLKGWINKADPRTEIYLTIITPDMPEFEFDKTPASYYDKLKARKINRQKVRRLLKRNSDTN